MKYGEVVWTVAARAGEHWAGNKEWGSLELCFRCTSWSLPATASSHLII
jgi:hypothetical protein